MVVVGPRSVTRWRRRRRLCYFDGAPPTRSYLMRSWYNRGVYRTRWHPVSGDDDRSGGRPDGHTSGPLVARYAAVHRHRTGPAVTRPAIALLPDAISKPGNRLRVTGIIVITTILLTLEKKKRVFFYAFSKPIINIYNIRLLDIRLIDFHTSEYLYSGGGEKMTPSTRQLASGSASGIITLLTTSHNTKPV